MKVQLVGLKLVSYDRKSDGKRVEGVELHVLEENSNVQGKAAGSYFIGKDKKIDLSKAKLDGVCDLVFNKFGSVETVNFA